MTYCCKNKYNRHYKWENYSVRLAGWSGSSAGWARGCGGLGEEWNRESGLQNSLTCGVCSPWVHEFIEKKYLPCLPLPPAPTTTPPAAAGSSQPAEQGLSYFLVASNMSRS